nr:MAG TPA: hypothetical protein [Bacteriophage sp.]
MFPHTGLDIEPPLIPKFLSTLFLSVFVLNSERKLSFSNA